MKTSTLFQGKPILWNIPPLPDSSTDGSTWETSTEERRHRSPLLIALAKQRNVEWELRIGLLPGLGVRVLPQHRALRVEAQPAPVRPLKHVRKHALLVHLGRTNLMMHRVRPIGHRDVPQHAHR